LEKMMTATRKKVRQQRAGSQRKQVQPAHKSMRGVPETVYGELKKITSFSLTPTAYAKLKQLSQELNLSASELLEQLARKETEVKRLFEPEAKQGSAFADAP
jgi:hypothetical protein